MKPMISAMLVLSMQTATSGGIVLGPKKELFFDDYLVESKQNVRLVVQQAVKHPRNPVLRGDKPWEKGFVTLYGSILHEGGKYRLWYQNAGGIGYAESADGLKWVKPALGIVKVAGVDTNLVCGKDEPISPLYEEFFGVLRDDAEPDPSRRYKMGFLAIDPRHSGSGGDPFHKGQRRGLGVAGSPDGIHWKLLENFTTEAICDGMSTWMLDPRTKHFVLYGRTKFTPLEIEAAWSGEQWYKECHWGRAVARAESANFVRWDYEKAASAPVVLAPDKKDKLGTEIYSMLVFPYEGIFIGLVQAYHALPNEATIDLQLAFSRDGVHFSRVADRQPFIALGPAKSWDSFMLSPANNPPIEVGNELRFYYAGLTYRHPPYKGPDPGEFGGSIGFAGVERDRFAALQTDENGEVLTKPLVVSGRTIHINAKCDAGQITVEVLHKGEVVARSEAVSKDSLNIPISWRVGHLPLDEEPVQLRVGLTNAKLFAIWAQ